MAAVVMVGSLGWYPDWYPYCKKGIKASPEQTEPAVLFWKLCEYGRIARNPRILSLLPKSVP